MGSKDKPSPPKYNKFRCQPVKCRNDGVWKMKAGVILTYMYNYLTVYLSPSLSTKCNPFSIIPGYNYIHLSVIITFLPAVLSSCSFYSQYIYLSAIITFLVVTIFVRLSAFAKLLVFLGIAVGYGVVMEYTHFTIFQLLDLKIR